MILRAKKGLIHSLLSLLILISAGMIPRTGAAESFEDPAAVHSVNDLTGGGDSVLAITDVYVTNHDYPDKVPPGPGYTGVSWLYVDGRPTCTGPCIPGNIGEFVAAVGVIVSLIYLALQIRQNTSSIRASAFHESAGHAADFNRAIGQEKETAHVFRTGLDGLDRLEDDDDRFRFLMLLLAMFRLYENVFFQHRAGTLSPESWDAWSASLRSILSNPVIPQFWDLRRLSFTESFRQFVEAEREKAESLPTFAELLEMTKRATQQAAEADVP